jgi:hypothetical protein
VIPVAPESRPTGVRALMTPAGGPGLRAVATVAAVGCQGDPRDDKDQHDQRRRREGDYRPGHVKSSAAKYKPGIPPDGVSDIMTLFPSPLKRPGLTC